MERGKIFFDFIILVYTFFREEKNVEFYAQRLGVTQQSLKAIIKEKSGISFEKWLKMFEKNEKNIL